MFERMPLSTVNEGLVRLKDGSAPIRLVFETGVKE